MVIATLDALARLDYDNFEVILLDNNTRDPAVWQPVEAHCAMLGQTFRFFHLDDVKGFKAGALNDALRLTDPGADYIAVIDSDYQVEPFWLRRALPYFASPTVALVQGPQDYRDGNEDRPSGKRVLPHADGDDAHRDGFEHLADEPDPPPVELVGDMTGDEGADEHGKELEETDKPEVEAIIGKIRDKNYGFRTLIHEIVQSKVFQTK